MAAMICGDHAVQCIVRGVQFLLAFLCTAFAATGGWIVWGVQRALKTRLQRKHELALAREREITERARVELEREALADRVYRDFADRKLPGSPPIAPRPAELRDES